jgi:CO/xanthine dehydrogenase Mo-binding subunit
LSLAARQDGRVLGLTVDILADTGAYASAGIPVLDQATLFATGPYDIPNVRINGRSVYTNNIACGAFRGFGIPQSAFAVESLVDELAEKLGHNPFEIRRINGLKPGNSTATGQVITASLPYLQTLDCVEEALKKSLDVLPPPLPGQQRGYGIASCFKNVGIGLGMPESTSAAMELLPGGKILVKVGGAELGQGSNTALAQIAAQSLGIPYGLVEIIDCDTALTPDGGITSASRTTFMSGNAIRGAAEEFLLRCREEFGQDTPLTQTALKNLAEDLRAEGRTLSVEHTYIPPATFPLDATGDDQKTKFVAFSYATQAAIVDVDTASREVSVVKMIAAHDVGRTINPLGARGQIEGSCVMGLGYALSEEFILDHGYLATDTLAKVGIPTINHSPPIEVILIEDPDPNGPFGAKGIAEAAAIPSAPAITNAIHAATGIRIRRLPATPDRIVTERIKGH